RATRQSGLVDKRKDFWDSLSGRGGDKYHGSIFEVLQPRSDLAFTFSKGQVIFCDEVPFVNHQDDRNARFMDISRNGRIQAGRAFPSVNHEKGNVAALQTLSCH